MRLFWTSSLNLKKIIQFSIGPIVAAALSLVTLPFVSWFFTVEDVGRLTMLQVVLGLAVSFFSLAMHQAYVREYHEEEDKQALFKLSVTPGLIFLLSISAIILILPFSVSLALFGIDSMLLTALLLLGIYSNFFVNFFAHVIRMEERGLAFSLALIAPKAFLLLFICVFLMINTLADFEILMLMNTLAVAFSLLIYAWLTRNTWRPALTKDMNITLLKKMLKFSLPLVAGGVAYWGLTTMDRFFLKNLSGFDELGVYGLSVALAGAVSVLSIVFSNLWHPVLYRWVKEGVDNNKVQFVIDNMVIAVAFIWSLSGLFSFIIPYFLPADYQAIEYLIVACIALPLFYMLAQTTGVGLGISRRSEYSMLASIFAFLTNALLNYLLIPSYGASGAALATVISFFVYFFFRTEASAWLWHSFPRAKIYIVTIAYVCATSLMVLTKASVSHFYVIWLGLFFITCVLYVARLKDNIVILKAYITERS